MKLLSKFANWVKKMTTSSPPSKDSDERKVYDEDIRHQHLQGSKEDLKIREILLNANKRLPEDDNHFLTYIPVMHNYDYALDYLNMCSSLGSTYIKRILARYNGKLPYKVERRLILSQKMNLLSNLSNSGYLWSVPAQKLIKKTIPKNLHHYFFGKTKQAPFL